MFASDNAARQHAKTCLQLKGKVAASLFNDPFHLVRLFLAPLGMTYDPYMRLLYCPSCKYFVSDTHLSNNRISSFRRLGTHPHLNVQDKTLKAARTALRTLPPFFYPGKEA